MKSKISIGATILCAAFALSAEAKLFKWVDDNGTTHYGETIPPEYANKETMQLDKGKIEKRGEKREAIARKASKDSAEEKARIKAERHDNALINTYSSEQEIDLARDRNLQQVEARTSSFTTLLKSAKENQTQLLQEHETLVKEGRKIPKSLEEDLLMAEERAVKMEADLNNSLKETEAVKARYAADKARYRELKGLAPK